MGPRIIVVHYDPEFLAGAAQMLQQAGFEVAAFENSLAAWDAVKQSGLEMLIIKVGVPDGQPNGVALAQMARGIALGRKAWLFAGSDRGGERAAAVYSLIVTAKLNNVDPRAWLADVLARIANHSASRLHELLPWHWPRPSESRSLAA